MIFEMILNLDLYGSDSITPSQCSVPFSPIYPVVLQRAPLDTLDFVVIVILCVDSCLIQWTHAGLLKIQQVINGSFFSKLTFRMI